jgi:endogenous inhibitor of DNA gyrase (YacG/DUF329 family)
MATAKCPTCGKAFDPATSRSAPFCSDRCRQIDLGRWLDEKHALPVEKPDEDESPDEAPDDSAIDD